VNLAPRDAKTVARNNITLLAGPSDATLPLFDTTRIHAEAAVAMALEG
jgi:aspartate/glutamate racemase